MKKKIIGFIVCIAMLAVIVLGITRADSIVLPDNLFTNKGSKEEQSDSAKKISTSKGSIDESQIAETDINKVDEKNVHKMQDVVETRGIQYKVQSFYISKEKGDFLPQPGAWQERCAVDENGNITGAYSYVVISLEVTNIKEQAQTVNFYNYGIDLLDQDGNSRYESGYINRPAGAKLIQSEDLKSAYEYTFQPGETINQVLAIVEADSMLADSKIDFLIWPEGMQGYHTNSRIIQLYE